MSNIHRTVLYIGMTNRLERRMFEHQFHYDPTSFTAKYNISVLLYFEEFDTPAEAISREKQLKGWTRKKKMDIIKQSNNNLQNLFDSYN